MSLTKKTKDNPVTSIADTDLVMCSVNGVYHPISFSNLMKAVRDGIQIGGRNLLRNSGNLLKTSSYLIGTYTYAETLNVGESFLITIWGSIGTGKTQFVAYHSNGDAANGFAAFTEISEGVFQGKLQILKEGSSQKLSVYSFPSSVTAECTIKRIKMERGNVGTDWSPAPEDIASDSWGGVIGLLPITYDYAEKGGAHDPAENACRQAEIGADSHLSFGSLDALAQFVGQACEDSESADSQLRCHQGFGCVLSDRILSDRVSIDWDSAGRCWFGRSVLFPSGKLDTRLGLQYSDFLQGDNYSDVHKELRQGHIYELATVDLTRKEVTV